MVTAAPDPENRPPASPYQPPATDLDSDDSQLRVRAVPASHGIHWWRDAWQIFCRSPWVIIGAFLIFCILALLACFVPFALTLLTPLLIGGFMIGFQKLDQGQSMDLSDLFAGFQIRSGQLIMVGVIQVVLGIISTIALLAVFFSFIGGLNGFNGFASFGVLGYLGLAMALLIVTFNLLIYVAAWFVPCLILFNKQEPIPAFKLCLKAFAVNWLPLLVYSLVMTLIFILGALPLLLGWLLVFPLTLVTGYTVYKDMFELNSEPTPI